MNLLAGIVEILQKVVSELTGDIKIDENGPELAGDAQIDEKVQKSACKKFKHKLY